MYDELVKSIRNCVADENGCCFRCPEDCNGPCQENLMTEAADAIEELVGFVQEAERDRNEYRERLDKANDLMQKQWIPVTEQLPECDLGVEVGNIEWISCGMVHSGCFGRGGKYRDAYFRTWTDAGEGMDAKDADYWRAVTLPEPPKEEA